MGGEVGVLGREPGRELEGRRLQMLQGRVERPGKVVEQLAAVVVVAVRHETGGAEKEHQHCLRRDTVFLCLRIGL